jgi:hypothetical protein
MGLRLPLHLLRLVAIAVFVALITAFLGASPASAATGSITGKVTRPDGTGSKTAGVDLYEVDADGFIYYVKSVDTRSDGTYTLTSLERGEYIVGFAGENTTYAAEFWNNEALIQDASIISVGTTRVSNINAKLEVGGKVMGRVRDDRVPSDPLQGVEVIAYRYDDGEWTYGKSAITGSDGRYTLGGLSDGQWTLEFNPPTEGSDANYALEYWEDSRVFDEDETFLVKPGMTVADLETHLSPGGRISGRVTGPDGEPVVDAFVFGYPSTSEQEVGNVAFTDENGDYVMTGLSPGEHRLEFVDALEFDPFGDGPAYLSEWWDDRESFDAADRITVTASTTTTGKNAQLDLAGTPLVNTAPPSISGTERVGETLTADPGEWTPRISDSTFEYQWFSNGTAIQNADEKSFALNSNHLDKVITVRVTADRGSGPVTATSAPTDRIAKGVLTPVRQPSILTADPRVGQKLTFDFGAWSPSASSTSQILADGQPIEYDSSTGVPAEALGKRLSVRQTSNWAGYEPSVLTSEETAPVVVGTFDPPTTAEISGAAIVGEQLRTTLVNSVNDGTYKYQWLADGSEVPGATSSTYTPTSGDVGKSLAVRLAMTSPGRTPAESTSDATDPVAESGTLKLTPGEIEIRGNARVGEGLSVASLPWSPSGVELTYQWLAGGEPISGATTEWLTLTAAQGGKKISIRVTGSKSGYADTSVVSAETVPVSNSTPFGAPRDFKVTGTTVSSVDLSWTAVSGAAKYRIAYGIGSGTRTTVEVGQVTEATLNGLKPNSKYSIDIAALPPSGSRSPYSPRITGQTVALVAPTSLAVSEKTSTSLTLTWKKAPGGVPKYRIAYGIGSGTRSTMQVGDVDTATITGLKPGTTYTIDMASVLSDGTRSSYTSRISAKTAP